MELKDRTAGPTQNIAYAGPDEALLNGDLGFQVPLVNIQNGNQHVRALGYES